MAEPAIQNSRGMNQYDVAKMPRLLQSRGTSRGRRFSSSLCHPGGGGGQGEYPMKPARLQRWPKSAPFDCVAWRLPASRLGMYTGRTLWLISMGCRYVHMPTTGARWLCAKTWSTMALRSHGTPPFSLFTLRPGSQVTCDLGRCNLGPLLSNGDLGYSLWERPRLRSNLLSELYPAIPSASG